MSHESAPEQKDPLDLISDKETQQAIKNLREALSEIHGHVYEGDEVKVHLKTIASQLEAQAEWKINPEAKNAVDRVLGAALREMTKLIERL